MGKLVNRARMTVASATSTVITLGSAVPAYATFAAEGVNDTDIVSYVMEDGAAWEFGQGQYAASGTTLTRLSVQGSSNGGAALASPSSAAQIYVAPLATDFAPIRGAITGLTTSNDATTPNTVLDIAAGQATSDDNLVVMPLASVMTKSIASAWAVGTGNGGLDSGSVAASTWYHVFLIERTDTSVVDVLFSASATAPTMPTNYTKKRRIGSIKTDASSHILAFVQNGDEFLWAATPTDVNNAVPNPTALVRLSVPTGVKVNALFNANVDSNSNTQVGFFSPDITTPAGSSLIGNTNVYPSAFFNVRTNASGQINVVNVSGGANGGYYIWTLGWIDTRGRFA